MADSAESGCAEKKSGWDRWIADFANKVSWFALEVLFWRTLGTPNKSMAGVHT